MPAPNGQDRRPSVGLVLTGGTIGAERHGSALTVASRPTGAEADLLASCWPLAGVPRVAVATPLRTLSENITPGDWTAIAAAVRELVQDDGVDGVLVLHGTDTMAYTAAALGFLLCDLDRPIVLTGSRLPADQPGSDAPANVRAALVALLALPAGAYVVFGGSAGRPADVHLATRVRKAPSQGATFTSVNRRAVATVRDDELVGIEPYVHRLSERPVQQVDARVLAVRLYPGLDFDAQHSAMAHGGVRGVVVELYPAATGPDTGDRFSLTAFVRRCAESEVIVAAASPGGARKGQTAYETTLAIANAGALFLADMSVEAATVKLMWALAQSLRPQDVRQLMLTPIAGELASPPPSR